MSPPLLRPLPLVVIPVCLVGVFFSLRYTLADLLSPSHLDLAIQLAPSNPDLLLRRGSPADLERAIQLAPASSAPLIALALVREKAGQPDAAEQLLFEAARIDATHTPKWSLANFYFRQNRLDKFWYWAKASTERYHGDLSALFRLGLMADPDPRAAFRLVPNTRQARRQFAEVAFHHTKPAAALFAAQALAADNNPADRDLLFSYCDTLLEQGEGEGAAKLAGAIDAPSPAGRCFGWRAATGDGITAVPRDAALALTLSGLEADPALVARRWVATTPGRLHRLHYRMQLELRAGSGHLRWKVAGETSAPAASEGQMLFRAPGDRTAVMLELVAMREIGLSKPEGKVLLETVTAEAQ